VPYFPALRFFVTHFHVSHFQSPRTHSKQLVQFSELLNTVMIKFERDVILSMLVQDSQRTELTRHQR